MNDVPVDLYGLRLLHLVRAHSSITSAARAAGLTQSALSRQIQVMEDKLGFAVFARTTRSVALTEAGKIFLEASGAVSGIMEQALRRVREEVLDVPPTIRIGVSRSLAAAHLPGLFASQRKRAPSVRIQVTILPDPVLLTETAEARLDLGVVTEPEEAMTNVVITHRMTDRFVLLTSGGGPVLPAESDDFRLWLAEQDWIMPPAGPVRALLDRWCEDRGFRPRAVMELDGFEATIELSALGMGMAFAPERALRGLAARRRVQLVRTPWSRPVRQIVVIAPKNPPPPAHAMDFLGRILFS
jgi:DNA-binding transcriptional LysR family regulator